MWQWKISFPDDGEYFAYAKIAGLDMHNPKSKKRTWWTRPDDDDDDDKKN